MNWLTDLTVKEKNVCKTRLRRTNQQNVPIDCTYKQHLMNIPTDCTYQLAVQTDYGYALYLLIVPTECPF